MTAADQDRASTRAQGRVVRADAKVFHIDIGPRTLLAAPRGKLFEELVDRKNPVAVGDIVEIDLATEPASIEAVVPRRNYLGRLASAHDPREQVLVANVDQLFVVGSLRKPGFSSNRTDRILAACQWHDIPAVVVLNKTDLARPGEVEDICATYRSAGVDLLETCAIERRGVDELAARLVERTSVFYGASGAGKSSLLNAIQPDLAIKVGKISKYWDTGKHTTTFSQLHRLESGGYVIDTPGIRVFRLHGLKPGELRGLFPEFARFSPNCRFPDCSHDHEPGCAVFPAVEAGELPATRFASYLEMLDELAPLSGESVPTEGAEPDED
jgi:ribosome biogenesis GTPase / thiamine phosphate phosphatase